MISATPFGTTPDGAQVTCYAIDNGSITVRVMDFGATIIGIEAPDENGECADIVLGYGSIDGYTAANPSCYGATIAPSANRIGGAELTIDGETWHLVKNEGENNLHTDLDHGLHHHPRPRRARPSRRAHGHGGGHAHARRRPAPALRGDLRSPHVREHDQPRLLQPGRP